jgi:hypothetical protein
MAPTRKLTPISRWSFRRRPWFGAVHAVFANPPIGHFNLCRRLPLLRRSKVLPGAFPQDKKAPRACLGSTARQASAFGLGKLARYDVTGRRGGVPR